MPVRPPAWHPATISTIHGAAADPQRVASVPAALAMRAAENSESASDQTVQH
jgi:hypothetical protein